MSKRSIRKSGVKSHDPSQSPEPPLPRARPAAYLRSSPTLRPRSCAAIRFLLLPFHSPVQGRLRRDSTSVSGSGPDRKGKAASDSHRFICHGSVYGCWPFQSREFQCIVFPACGNVTFSFSTALPASTGRATTVAAKSHPRLLFSHGKHLNEVSNFREVRAEDICYYPLENNYLEE